MRRTGLIIATLALFACAESQTTGRIDEASPREPAPLTYLAMGDSYTIGEGVGESMRFPVQLGNLMRTRGAGVEPPRIVAETGWTTEELAAGIEAADPAAPFDLVTLLIGVNDQYRGRDPDEFRIGLQKLIDTAIGLAGDDPSSVIVVSIPDWGVTPFAAGRNRVAIAEEIDEFNRIARQLALESGTRWVNVTELSRGLSRHESMLAADGLHPSGMMYSEWARRILPQALDAVK